ncbi:hypothetical protein BH09MYX1_BH09MYX1_39720 [soil metagenome]
MASEREGSAVTKIRSSDESPSPTQVESPVAEGTILGGKYRVGRIIGVGGVGVVVAAEHLELDEPVAIKFLRADASHDPGIVARFSREAKAAVSIRSEHVARVLDVAKKGAGLPYFVMEYLDGHDLGAIVVARGQLPVSEAIDYAMQAGEALSLAHARGIVHRDVKPENIFLARQSQGLSIIKVLDFGISKASLTGSILGAAIPLVTTQNVMGTPLYMAPEQVRSTEAVDPRTDIWALGMVIYELLTGTTAFNATTITELSAQILESRPTPVQAYRDDVPDGLSSIVMRCLEKRPEDRYQNMAELLASLLPFAPKRSRAHVERSSTALMAAGMMEHAVEVRSHAPPALDGPRDLIRIAPHAGLPTEAASAVPIAVESETQGPPRGNAARSGPRWSFAIAGIGVGLVVAAVLVREFAAPRIPPPPPNTLTTADPSTRELAPSPMASAAASALSRSPTLAPASGAALPLASAVTITPNQRSPRSSLPTAKVPSASASADPSTSPSAAAAVSTQKSDEPDLGY